MQQRNRNLDMIEIVLSEMEDCVVLGCPIWWKFSFYSVQFI